jgi:predicted CXXCH cytochrome family protein
LTSPQSTTKVEEVKIDITKEMEEKYPLKPIHNSLAFECIFCHEGQGTRAEEFKAPQEKVCLSCHKSKEYLATRLEFMDTLKNNPHNSVHDGPNLYCDECHMEHKPSINMCTECHEREIKTNMWMRQTP